jgi:hypothetical protein
LKFGAISGIMPMPMPIDMATMNKLLRLVLYSTDHRMQGGRKIHSHNSLKATHGFAGIEEF